MTTTPIPRASVTTLASALLAALDVESVDVLDRRRLDAGTHPKEIVTCSIDGADPITVLCKHGGVTEGHVGDHRGGVAYEADVYGHVLRPLGAAGELLGIATEPPLLVLRLLDPWSLMSKTEDLSGPLAAADWLGAFHLSAERFLADERPAFLHTHDLEYFTSWADRAARFAASVRDEHGGLEAIREAWPDVAAALLHRPPTIVHGEYFERNVLLDQGRVVPVDWESAAISAGEIDVASLIEGWPSAAAGQLIDAYVGARWGGRAPDGFEDAVIRARMYWTFRWLGDRPEWTADHAMRLRFQELQALGGQLGVGGT